MLLAGGEPVETGVRSGVGGHGAVFVDDLNFGQAVAASGFKIVEIVRGGDFDGSGAEFGVGQIVENDGNFAIHQRQLRRHAVEFEIALIFGIDGDRRIAQHGFRARSGDHDEAAGYAVDGIAQMPEVALDLGVSHFKIGERSVAAGAPVDHVLAAVDEVLFVQADEDLAHGSRESGIEREALAAPIAACAKAHHLALDRIAVLLLPFPDALLELFASQVGALDAFFGEFALDHHLGGDAGVIGSRQPEGVFAQHAMPANGDVDLGVFQHVADVEDAGHIRRWDHQREDLRAGFGGSVKNAGIDPPLGPVRLELLRFVDLYLVAWRGVFSRERR